VVVTHVDGQRFQGYQIHLGRTVATGRDRQRGTYAFVVPRFIAGNSFTGNNDGWLSADGWCAGCYLHGLFENDSFRQGVLAALMERRSMQFVELERVSFNRQLEYDKLARL